jgi:hypothetical protein
MQERIDNDEGWPLGGLDNDDHLGYDDAGHHRVISKHCASIHG